MISNINRTTLPCSGLVESFSIASEIASLEGIKLADSNPALSS
jgi:hypothetical protein